MPDLKKATVKHLAHQIKGYGSKPNPRFAFFLGAGASVQSGIPAAGWRIRDFKRRIVARECPDECKSDSEKDAWITSQSWFNPDKQYSSLFEHLESKEIGRQRYIEQLIEGRKPSFGYVMLANLLATGYINTISTTNFDDLFNGDFLYSQLKNTTGELATQDQNMADQTGRVLGEYDWVVIGHSGGDEDSTGEITGKG